MLRRFVLLLWLCCAGGLAPVRAALFEAPQVRMLGVRDGLPSSSVAGLARDRDGYLWIATTDGLARYDGVSVRVWRHVDGQPDSLPGNSVTAIHVDANDRIWLATEGRGLSMLDVDRRGFRHYRRATHPQIGSDETWALASRGDEVWFGTYEGLHRLDAQGRITRFMPADGLPDAMIYSLAVDDRQGLWIGTAAGIARWNGSAFETFRLPGKMPRPTVLSITPDRGGIWVGTDVGVFRRESDGRWTVPAWSSHFTYPNPLFSMLVDRDGYWLGGMRGLWRVTGRTAPVPVHLGARGPVVPVPQMLRQPDGTLWLPVAGRGVGHLAPDWRRIAQVSRERGGLRGAFYRGLAPAETGGFWLVGNDGVIDRLHPDGRVTPGPSLAGTPLAQADLRAVLQDPAGALWVTRRSSLVRFDETATPARWSQSSPQDPTLPSAILALRPAAGGGLWVASQSTGLQLRDREGRVQAQLEAGADNGLGIADMEAIEVGPDAMLWVASADGLGVWDVPAKRWRPAPGLPRSDRVFGFAFAGRDELWLQRLVGLEHYRLRNGRWQRMAVVGRAQGLPNVEGHGLLLDQRGRAWLSSERGLFRWDPVQRRLRHFGIADGFSSQELLDNTLVLDRNGVLASAVADGSVLLLDTRAEDAVAEVPPLRVDRVDVRRDGHWSRLDARVPQLRHDEREMRIQLRLLSYDDPSAHRYFTWLEGYDPAWVEHEGNDRGERIVAGIPIGRHTLRARAVDARGNPAAEQILHFEVLPPWWLTPAALAGFLGILALLAWWAWDRRCTQLRRRQNWFAAKQERELASQASQAKTRFLATLGHEVRTPMTGVLGMSELLLGTPLTAQQRRFTESIRSAGEHMLRLVNDALDLARIESGRLELADEPFDLRGVIEEVVALMAPLAQRKGLRFDVMVPGALELGRRGDASRIRQILLNLLSNAIKFTERGRVWLRLSYHDVHEVQFEIGDTGPGLNVEQQARLFRRFEQADGLRTAARYGGSGLGLAICQEFAAAMGGSIRVDSVQGEGARFSLRLPLPVDVVPPLPAPTEIHLPRLSILLVEDDPTVAEVVAGLLRSQGHRVTHVAHGLAALSEAATAPFDIALLDLDLPGIDGFALAQHLRAQGFLPPLVALTARSDGEAEKMATEAGFDEFVRKPVTGGRLAEVLQRASAERAPASQDVPISQEA